MASNYLELTMGPLKTVYVSKGDAQWQDDQISNFALWAFRVPHVRKLIN